MQLSEYVITHIPYLCLRAIQCAHTHAILVCVDGIECDHPHADACVCAIMRDDTHAIIE